MPSALIYLLKNSYGYIDGAKVKGGQRGYDIVHHL
jgi:hypothetical protein